MYVYKNKSTSTFDVFVSVWQVARNLDILPIYNWYKVESYLYKWYLHFVLYYTGAVTNITKLRQKGKLQTFQVTIVPENLSEGCQHCQNCQLSPIWLCQIWSSTTENHKEIQDNQQYYFVEVICMPYM